MFGQDPIIIGDPVYGGNSIPFQDTTLTSYYNQTINSCFDLDGDGANDIRFRLYMYYGGMGFHYTISVSTYQDFQVIIDTSFQTYFQHYDSVGNVVGDTVSYTIAKQYFNGDTIDYNQESRSILTDLLEITYSHEVFEYGYNIDVFVGDTCFIAFYKTDESSTSIYYIKLFIEYMDRIRLFSAKTNDIISSTPELKNEKINLFPNPVSDWINIKGDLNQFQIFSLNGQLLFSEEIYGKNNRIDLSFLNPGIYIVKLIDDEEITVRKIIKK